MFIKAINIHNKNFPVLDRYPFNLGVLRGTDRVEFKSCITFFAGENGTGKSTLLEAIARKYGLTIWGGEKTHIVHRNPYETRLYDFIAIEEGSMGRGGSIKGFIFRAENFFNYASNIDDFSMSDPGILQYYGGSSLNKKSHGQAFLSFLENRCKLKGLYLLDEPEAALSPSSQLAFLEILWKTANKGEGQFIISTHSPIILSCPGAHILSFDDIPIKEIAYRETRSYRFYKNFMADTASYLRAFTEAGKGREEDDYGQGKL